MGGICSRASVSQNNKSLYAGGRVDHNGSGSAGYQRNELQANKKINLMESTEKQKQSNFVPAQTGENMEKQSQELKESIIYGEMDTTGYSSNEDDFYDGIPRFPRALSRKSRSIRSKQVSEVSSRLGRASSFSLEKAVDVLDTLGSSMANLNPSSGFVFGATSKGNKLSILAFEVANTIVKGSSLLQSLSKRSIRMLKEKVLPSEGVQLLVSKDMDELLRIVAADKREELKVFAGEVVRFGNRCKDSQWHNLDLYFEKHGRQFTTHRQLKEDAELVMQQLMTLVQYTVELYHELHALDRLEQDYQVKRLEVGISNAVQRGDGLSVLRAELTGQRKQVTSLKKKSLWSRSMEEVMEKLADIVLFLNREIHDAFGHADGDKPSIGSLDNMHRLGPAGLSLHYANVIIQIDTIVARSSAMPSNSRDTLYQSLPPTIKSSLRSKLQSFCVKEELTVTEIKAEMEKTLQWLVPTAVNTAKFHHGFGWVGEWANTGSAVNRKPTGPTDVIQIETLHHADRKKTEAYILELVLWLNHLVSQSKVNGGGTRSPIRSPNHSPLQRTNQQPVNEAACTSSSILSTEEQEMLRHVSNNKRTRGISKSRDFEFVENRLRKHERPTKSCSNSPSKGSEELFPLNGLSSGISVIDVCRHKEKPLNVNE
ncbi:protein PSK SIMULATOR 1-like isoform X2 [Cornus florida]|uniref:protein PSK SIMULATOR 1-like isoform X2 n=1 Tax=Cornus florida TaxID=4283 RepID=UPI0028A1E680|nr:protein PSK SIMULATOR 1-like isoform X2 [Cornus florida]